MNLRNRVEGADHTAAEGQIVCGHMTTSNMNDTRYSQS